VKIKIAILSASILFVILVVFGGFIYFTVYTRVSTIQNSELANTAQTIAQYYSAHANNGRTANWGLKKWLVQYSRHDQDVVIFGPKGNVIEAVGHLDLADVVTHFRPVKNMKQQMVRLPNDSSVMFTTLPVSNAAGTGLVGYVTLASDVSPFQEYMESLLTVLAVGCLGAVVLAGFGGYLIAAAALRPIQQLIRVVEGIEANRLDERVPPPSTKDEVGRLALTFNNMLSRIQRSFAQQTRFVADASHEIRTPLTTILGYTNLLIRWGKTDPNVLDRAIQVIQKESLRLLKLADDLLFLAGLEASRHEAEQRTLVDPVVADVVDQLSVIYPQITVHKDLQADVEIRVTADHLRQMITNLVSNALKYTPAEGMVTVQTSRKDDDWVVIVISDTGCGIPKEDLPHVFERFYRADKSRERKQGGNGLGLAIVKELVEHYGGTIDIESEENQGTSISVSLPIAGGANP
jgi:two-component system, OmpR family, sensor histidine kinase ArlS